MKKALSEHAKLEKQSEKVKNEVKSETKEVQLPIEKQSIVTAEPLKMILKSETSLECPVCHVTLDSLDSKKDHMKNIHHNLRTFECNK